MKSIAILGGGESGIGAALLAKEKNIEVFVSDYGVISQSYKDELEKHKISFEEKGHTLERVVSADLIVKSPGIPDSSEILTKLRLRHKKIISEIELAYRYYEGKIIAITGSNGKTTTTSWIYHILKASNLEVGLGGNIGHSFARLLSSKRNFDWVVLELSSFQLDNIESFSADIAILLNITPDHLDRYDHTMYKYASAKWRLAQSVAPQGHLILNGDDEWLQLMQAAFPVGCHKHTIGDKEIKQAGLKGSASIFEKIKLQGKHNLFNAHVAYKACRLFGLSENLIEEGLKSFRAIEHRLESFAEISGVEFINDSKATNIDSVFVALSAMIKPVIWIAGGTDKGNDYSLLASLVKEKVKAIICLTTDDSKLRSSFGDDVSDIETTEDTETCVRLAMKKAEVGDVVLLSPACASFDLFDNYEHRGTAFKTAVRNIEI